MYGFNVQQAVRESVRQKVAARPNAGPGRIREDDNPVQIKTGLGSILCADDRFQRVDCLIPKGKIHGVGRRRSGQDTTTMETLLPKHSSFDLCR